MEDSRRGGVNGWGGGGESVDRYIVLQYLHSCNINLFDTLFIFFIFSVCIERYWEITRTLYMFLAFLQIYYQNPTLCCIIFIINKKKY